MSLFEIRRGHLVGQAPAKVNLFLKVLYKRPDGFHELSTLFERISLADELTFKASQNLKVTCSDPKIPQGAKNLVYKAAELLKKECRVTKGVSIHIQKNIPSEAGLGGGSSDAATALLGLNRFWKLKLPRKRLLKYAAQLGSDVPFFILDTSWALGLGRGEKLTPLTAKGHKNWFCLIKPAYGISTAEAFRAFNAPLKRPKSASLTGKKADARMTLHLLQKGDLSKLQNLAVNHLEVIGNKGLKQIFNLKAAQLNSGAQLSLMSGSGSTVFGVFPTQAEAENAAKKFRKDKSLKIFVASTY